MLDHLTYADLAGRRHLRRYVIAAVFIFVFIGLLLGWTGWPRLRSGAERSASDAATHGETARLAAVAKREGVAPTPETVNCPTDPELWHLLDVYPGDNYKRIEPGCIYAALAKTVAWHMLERLGYTKAEAAALLDFGAFPWQPAQSITGLTNMKGPMVLPLEMEWAPHPAYRTWTVDTEGQAALAYSLRGCYRTRTIVGNRLESWGNYPVICVLAYDRVPGWTVTELGELRFAVDMTAEQPQRRFALFGYSGVSWVLLGEPGDWQIAIEEPSIAGQERERVTARYGLVPWDAAWLEATYGLKMLPLPDGWRMFGTDPAVIQTITSALDGALAEIGGTP